jgi:hypothetical protein
MSNVTATKVAHGVIQIVAQQKKQNVVINTAALHPQIMQHAVSTGAAPAPVVHHKTSAQIEAEAAALAQAAAALEADAKNVQG